MATLSAHVTLYVWMYEPPAKINPSYTQVLIVIRTLQELEQHLPYCWQGTLCNPHHAFVVSGSLYASTIIALTINAYKEPNYFPTSLGLFMLIKI